MCPGGTVYNKETLKCDDHVLGKFVPANLTEVNDTSKGFIMRKVTTTKYIKEEATGDESEET